MGKEKVREGDKVGSILVLTKSAISTKAGRYWNCICDCGNKRTLPSCVLNPLNKRVVKSCGCKRYDSLKTGTKDISGTYYRSIVAGAKHRKKEFSLSIEYLQELWVKQGGRCAISGLPIELINKRRFAGQSASLDRIDSSKGYTKGNVQWVDVRINFMKLRMSTEEFVEMCRIVVKNKK